MKKILTLGWPFVLLWAMGCEAAPQDAKVKIGTHSQLPPPGPGERSLGYAGMLGGQDGQVLLAGGGANFPHGLPWEGGPKVWSDALYVFEDKAWRKVPGKLPKPLAYGASVSLPEGVLCLGGENGEGSSDRVFLMEYDPSSGKVVFTDYPSLPEPLAYTQAVHEGGHVYVVGGKNATRSTNAFYRMSLAEKKWERLPDFPGPPRALHVAVVQGTPEARKLFVIGGRDQALGKKSVALPNFLSFDLGTGSWKEEGDILVQGSPRVLMGASAEPMGSTGILVHGGSDEVLFDLLETIALRLAEKPGDSIYRQLIGRRDAILNDHPGFSPDVLHYHTVKDQWTVYGTLERPLPVTALSFRKGDALIILSGEVSPGIRTPAVQELRVKEPMDPLGGDQ